jgi:Tol biopolymer transport system component
MILAGCERLYEGKLRIAFCRAGDVFIINEDGTGETPVLTGMTADYTSWSPDGRLIAFRSAVSGNKAYVVRPDGSGLACVSGPHTDITSVTWDPAGRIVYTTASGNIFFANLAGNEVLSLCAGGALNPSISPDESMFAYGTVNYSIYSLQPCSLLQASMPGSNPTWSPDGTRLAYIDISGLLHFLSGQPPFADMGPSSINASSFSWSPDGQKIVYEYSGSIYILDIKTGSSWGPLTSGIHPCFECKPR